MTCKDCKNFKNCTEPNKSKKYDDYGECWADWCDCFENKRKGNVVRHKDFVCSQSSYNWHITIWDTTIGKEKMLMHISARKRYSKHKLKKLLKSCLKMMRGEK